jgi:alkane 1-monooxygenase
MLIETISVNLEKTLPDMFKVRVLKYSSPLIIYALAALSFTMHGWWCWITILYAWVFIPGIELILPPDERNMDAAEEEMAKKNRSYDFFLYLVVFLQFPALLYFLFSMKATDLQWHEIMGRIYTMGLLCGTFGINVGHELGHRVNKFEQVLAKASLLSSLYMHFFIEHNKGHHKNVATPEDPSSARYGEILYTFFFRTIFFSYTSAWKIANKDAVKNGHKAFSIYNEMLQAQLIQLAFVATIWFFFGGTIMLYYLAAAFTGILLLETVNYIEHYGLSRKETGAGKYERAMPQHSWNSNHVIGRLMLFELSRHSDHHYLASRKYQVLRHHDHAPQMPTGYPGMMILSLIPPAWFYVMNKRVQAVQNEIVKPEPQLHNAMTG